MTRDNCPFRWTPHGPILRATVLGAMYVPRMTSTTHFILDKERYKMNKIAQWSDALVLGIPEIDGQHKGLLDMVNALWEAIVSKAETQKVEQILGELIHYTQAHFTAEEALMRVESYPRFREHRVEHQDFIKQVAAAQAGLAKGQFLGLDLLHYLTDWLVKHIQGGDKHYASFIAEKHRPKSFFARFFAAFRPQHA